MTYAAPSDDMRFVLDHLAGMAEIATFPGFEDAEPGLVEGGPDPGSPLRDVCQLRDIGGQGNASNLAFSLCQILTRGAAGLFEVA